MTSKIDPRRSVGTIVHAKAIHVFAEAECGRLYGKNKKKKLIEGTVIEVKNVLTKNGRPQCYVVANYKKPNGDVKQATLHIKSVKAGPVPLSAPAPAGTAATLAFGNQAPVPPETATTQGTGNEAPAEIQPPNPLNNMETGLLPLGNSFNLGDDPGPCNSCSSAS